MGFIVVSIALIFPVKLKISYMNDLTIILLVIIILVILTYDLSLVILILIEQFIHEMFPDLILIQELFLILRLLGILFNGWIFHLVTSLVIVYPLIQILLTVMYD